MSTTTNSATASAKLTKAVAMPPLDALIADIYNEPKLTSNTPSQLLRRVKERHKNVTLGDVKRFLEKQEAAQLLKKPSTRRPPHMNTTRGITQPNQKAQMDLADLSYLSVYNNGFKWLLIVIDVYSKYAVAFPMKNKNASTVANYLRALFTKQNGFYPRIIQSDRGSEFVASVTQRTMKSLGIKQVFSAPYSPQSNGIAEAFVKTIKGLLYAHMERTKRHNWVNALADSLQNYNSREHTTTQAKPVVVHFSTEPLPHVQKIFATKEERNKKKRGKQINKGDHVRIHILKDPATLTKANQKENIRQNKKFTAQWSKKIYVVSEKRGNRIVLEGIDAHFSPNDLQKVSKLMLADKLKEVSGERFELEQHMQELPQREQVEAPPLSAAELHRKQRREQAFRGDEISDITDKGEVVFKPRMQPKEGKRKPIKPKKIQTRSAPKATRRNQTSATNNTSPEHIDSNISSIKSSESDKMKTSVQAPLRKQLREPAFHGTEVEEITPEGEVVLKPRLQPKHKKRQPKPIKK